MGIELSERYKLLLGDFREVGKEIPDNSIDMIFTDPPYLKEYIPVYGDLAKFALRVLKIGGSLITYCNHHFLPEILSLMTPHLKYIWIIANKQTGPMAKIKGYGILVRWKPLLLFAKEKYKVEHLVIDLIESEYQGKAHHIWQQSTSEAEYLINQITKPDDIICDPFLGGGTTGVVTITLNRKFIGIEKEEATYHIAENRIKNSINYQLSKWC